MALVPGLSPNLRLIGGPGDDAENAPEITVELDDDVPGDQQEVDEKGNILHIEHGDGSISISIDGRPLGKTEEAKKNAGWFDNLAEFIDAQELSRIANELDRGIEEDLSSRKEWIEDRTNGVKLLGLKVELPGQSGPADSAPLEGMSKVRHPLLMEAVLRFQANARSEMLPTDGPVKIRDDSTSSTVEITQQANALETDLNHYLTAVATEYYPDTDRMFLLLGFGGTSFKKVYQCPLRQRPVSETVDADDLIVNQNATDLNNAKRITHRISMRPSTVKRMQIIGVYRDIDLGQPTPEKLDSLQEAERAQQGVDASDTNPEDRNRLIYECLCELDIKGYEHKKDGRETGLEVPYRVTLDASSKEILSIVRHYDEDTKDLPVARRLYIKYSFVPGFGFYDIGLLHILGNTTNAITAAWREMLDAGMFASFPGFLYADDGGRQNTNIFRVPPGGGALIKTGGKPITQAVMPLPYQPPSAALMQLVQDMAETGQRVGGTSELQVGEGRQDVPVGTTLAQIEQAVKILNAVHKRMHASQAEEFQLLKACFREHPESFFTRKCKSKTKWDRETFLHALENCDLVPQADPNTASNGQRMLKVMGLKQLEASSPTMFDPIAINKVALQAMGWSNPDQFFAPLSAQQAPPPEVKEIEAKIQNDTARAQADVKEADAKALEANARAAEVKARTEQGGYAGKGGAPAAQAPETPPQDTPADLMNARARFMDAETKRAAVGLQAKTAAVEDQNRDLDRQSDQSTHVLELAKTVIAEGKRADTAKHTALVGAASAVETAKARAAAKPKTPKNTKKE